ncbi:MAG TPA: EAL domain-containing protein, partial [Nevskiaceae bacterium]|nr:EAL domain-containing protein [Nevskiaceae bacterium]
LSVVTPGCDWARMVEEAGQACENAKQRGFNQVSRNRRRAASHPATSPHSSDLIANFRKYALQERLALHPQPIMDISGPEPRLAKAEFLLRYIDGERATPLPAHTIETLEHFGLAAELDQLASRQLLEWLSNNPATLARLESVSLNLSARSIIDGHFINRLYSEVKNAHLPEGKLCFEITETAAIENLEVASEVIALFQDIGCKFSLDDFGSGLCSFGYLHTLHVDEVKIDGRFTRDITRSFVSLEIVRAIQQVAKATGKKTVAEFVDAPEKLAVLQDIGVDYGQGWLFSPCITPEMLKQMLLAPGAIPATAATTF